MNRRQFLTTSLKASLGLAVGGGLLGLAEAGHCVVTSRTISLTGLAPAFDGFRIALLSDFHHSAWVSAGYIRRVIAKTNALKPDLIALTGDYVHGGTDWAPSIGRELSALRAPAGVFGVLGNHDHYKKAAPAVRHALKQAGVEELTNRGIDLRRGPQTLRLAGVGDYWREKQRLHLALDGVRTAQSVVLLQHNPDYVEKITDDRVGLVLSGHTHGGQCVFPFIGAPILPSRYGQKYASGLCRGPLAQVFVTRGIGTSQLPVRFRCPPEIALLTLRKTTA